MSQKMSKLEKRQDAMDFTRGSIFRKLVGFMAPILGALILQAMYGAVDILVVGWFGSDVSISAVSTGSSFINVIIFVLTGLVMGVTICMGRYIGEGKKDRLSQVIGGAIYLFGIIAIVLTFVLPVFAPFFANLLQAPADALDATITYIRICGGGIFFIIGYNLISSIFRGIGNSRLPLVFVGIASVSNIIFDLLFVAVFHLDVAGAAIATVLAQALSLILSFVVCKKATLPFEVSFSDIRMNPEVKRFFMLGLPIAFQELLTEISFICLLAFVNSMGTTEAIRLASSSGYGVANKVVSIIMLVPAALMQSMSSFIAQNVGAGKERRAQRSMGYGMLIGGFIGIFMTSLAFFGGQQVAALFTSDLTYQLKAAEYLQGFCLEGIITAVLFSYMGYFNGHNQTLWVLIQGILQSFVVRLPMAYIMSVAYPDTLVYVGLAAPTATFFGIFINTAYYIYFTHKIEKIKVKGM